ncbi:hypothetical protein G7Z17_g3434 [Cylindrodendrum hubeiense]|uniref:Uncharacterized protein n=1 Tax=Cylindrodendrum hubeiense TaxID=595255 RepID=A0A9P5HFU6_9HYPO|nr:hypothetical protein G7Z17_g3434 [Cylindrodendrum hubeiense]
MGRSKDQMIEQMEEEREDLERALDDIEAFGENFECPDGHCDSKVCSKSCFARYCFDWCLTHNHPSVEDRDGSTTVPVQHCDCHIVTSPFAGDVSELWQFEQERQMLEMMARGSP